MSTPEDFDGARQWCPTCAEGDPNRADGAWVEIEGHEHNLPHPRGDVDLYAEGTESEAALWQASLNVWAGNHWLGSGTFPTLPEAMEHARRLAIAEHKRRSEREGS